ncbi:hypothetical protein PInf_025840 [Phytophthora infestans]|nr:hypothetical protein PInf_025840 [Phytophthora infestans]
MGRVTYINNRRETDLGTMNRWSWEPRTKLREDDFAEEVDLVDRWKDSSVPLFEDFRRDDQVGVGLLGADDDGLCELNAFKRVAELAGRPDLATQQDIDQYVEDILVQSGRDLREGAAWTDVRDYLRQLRDGGRDIAYNAFVKKNYTIPDRRGARVLEEIEVKDGIYIVGAYNHRLIGHGAVLTVQRTKRILYALQAYL